MPPKFTYKNPDTNKVQFSCHINRSSTGGRRCGQCNATRKATFKQPRVEGQPRCKRGTCLNSLYCFQHLILVCKLRIQKSAHLASLRTRSSNRTEALSARKEPLGLYVWDPKAGQSVVYKKGDIIRSGLRGKSMYGGEILTDAALSNRYDYRTRDGRLVEATAPYAIQLRGNIVDAACKRGPAALANDRRPNKQKNAEITRSGNLRVLRDLTHNSEILVDYGEEYWK